MNTDFALDAPTRVGRFLYAFAIIAIGVQTVLWSDGVPRLMPLPATLPARLALVELVAAVSLVGGVGLVFDRVAHVAAFVIGAMMMVWVVALHGPLVVAGPFMQGAWVGLFETLAVAAAALVLGGVVASRRAADANGRNRAERITHAARILFALCPLAFGVSHFVYADFVASFVPAWIPARPFWAAFTGAAHIAAALAMLANVKARLAAILLAIMYGSWVLVLHVPRAIADSGNHMETNGVFVALALSAGALIVAGTFEARGRG